MPVCVTIHIGKTSLQAELRDTACAVQVIDCLPIEAFPEVWGDEFYFAIPVDAPPDETATTKVKAGDIGYWPPGKALTIFFGPTPMSRGTDPVPVSAVNLIGKIIGDPSILKQEKEAGKLSIVRGGDKGEE